jgi:hypothetical protein
MPHIHLRGKDMTFQLIYPNGKKDYKPEDIAGYKQKGFDPGSTTILGMPRIRDVYPETRTFRREFGARPRIKR